MNAILTAAAETLNRDRLWKESPPLEDGCNHDLELLPIIEFRQTVVCANCGGLDVERSRRLQREPGKILEVAGQGLYIDGARMVSRIRPDEIQA